MEINWTVLTYFVIGLFALSGFFKGWWKEAVTTVLLAILVFLLKNPTAAELVIETLNRILAAVWTFIPNSLLPTVNATLNNALGVDTSGAAIQANAGDASTWLIILILVIAVATIFGRTTLPGGIIQSGIRYAPTPTGSVLGGLIGGLNGFLIMNLIREYLDGRNLPGGLLTEIAPAGGGSVGIASSGVAIRAVEVPSFTILDSFLPWIIIGGGLLIFLAVLNNRVGLHSNRGFRRIDYKVPYGYKLMAVAPPQKK